QRFSLRDEITRVLTGLFALGDLFRGLITLSFQCLDFSDGLGALCVHFGKVAKNRIRIDAAAAQAFGHCRQVVANEAEIKHGELNVPEMQCSAKLPGSITLDAR